MMRWWSEAHLSTQPQKNFPRHRIQLDEPSLRRIIFIVWTHGDTWRASVLALLSHPNFRKINFQKFGRDITQNLNISKPAQ